MARKVERTPKKRFIGTVKHDNTRYIGFYFLYWDFTLMIKRSVPAFRDETRSVSHE